MARLTDEQRRFLRENAFAAVVTTLREDGSPHSTVVWADEDGGEVVFNTALGRAKPRHLERDPRVSVLMVDPGDQYKWVSVSGRAALTTDGAKDHIDHMSRKYMGKDYPWHREGEQRAIVRVAPEKVDSSGFPD